ncbi:MAG: PAS domain S-box protein [Holophagales bacterium]|nr:PAS domain S-box protein [Holophagales bacterium]
MKMVQLNTLTNEILLKIVYYGPGLSGKTANLYTLHAKCREDLKGEFFSVNTQEDRTLFFDLLPISLGTLYGKTIRLKVYTVPGQPQYDATRRVVLDSADGVVFVADSSESKMKENIDSLTNMQHNLSVNGLDIKQIPLVIQYNKRDLTDAMPVGVMNRKLNFRSAPYFESVAITGTGVLETFIAIVKGVVSATFQKHNLDKSIQNFNSLLETLEVGLRKGMCNDFHPVSAPIDEKTTIVRHENTSIEDLPEGRLIDPNELLPEALNFGIETASLYSELKGEKEDLERRYAELIKLNAQIDKASQDNLKMRRYLESLIQSIGVAIISFGLDGRVITWNLAAESIFGYLYAEAMGRSVNQFMPPDSQTEIELAIHNLRRGALSQNISDILIHRDGAEISATMDIYPLLGNDGAIAAYSALIRKTDPLRPSR